jgi:hypothetical protein
MAYTVLLHVANSEPILAEIDDLPKGPDSTVLARNPRTRDNKEIRGLDEGVTQVVYPMWRINYIQVLPAEDGGSEIELPFRD